MIFLKLRFNMRLQMSKKRTEEKEILTKGLRILAQIIAREIVKKILIEKVS